MFLCAFENIIQDVTAIPNKSVIILNQEEHYCVKSKTRQSSSFLTSAKKLKLAAHKEGQQQITKYFQTVKSSAQPKAVKEELPVCKIEEIIRNVRGHDSQIKILWIPKANIELNPCSYISVIFNNQVVKYKEENIDVSSWKQACERVIDLEMPNNIWAKIVNYVEKLEDEYKEEDERRMNRENLNDTAETNETKNND